MVLSDIPLASDEHTSRETAAVVAHLLRRAALCVA